VAIDRIKVAEAAQKFSLKGQYTKAIAELQKIVAEDNNDVRTLQRIAELYLKANNPGDAVRTYAEVALIYEAGGFFAKAVAVYRQVIKLSPDELEAKIRLANLYYQTGMLSDALLLFDQVSQAYLQAGDPASYITILTRMVELDPDHVGNRIRLAEQYAEDKLMLPAREHFNAAADTLHRTRRLDEFVKVAERLLIHFPDEESRHRQLIRALTETQRGARAIPRIQRLLERDPHDAEALELLIEALVSMGEKGRAIAVLRELAAGYREDGHRQHEERVLRRIIALDPDDAGARESLSLQGLPAAPVEANASLSTDEIERRMGEVDVFLKYSLYDRATDHLRQLLKSDPSNQRVIRRKIEVHTQAGQDQAAVREIVRLARLVIDEDLDRAALVVSEADAIVPGHLDVREFLEEVEARRAASRPRAPAPRPAPPVGDAGSFSALDALFGGPTAPSGQGPAGMAADAELLGQLESSLVQSGIAQLGSGASADNLATISLGTEDFLPGELDDALTEVAILVREGDHDIARARLFELLGEWPEHAELVLARIDELPSGEPVHHEHDEWTGAPSSISHRSVADESHGDLFLADDPEASLDETLQRAPQRDAIIAALAERPQSAGAPLATSAYEAISPDLLEEDDDFAIETGESIDESGIDAPVGRPSSHSVYMLTLSDSLLRRDPDAAVARAIRLRLSGNMAEALAILAPERTGGYAAAATYEHGLCLLAAGSLAEAATELLGLLRVRGLAQSDYLLVQYYVGLAYEAAGQGELAAGMFLPLWEHAPEAFPDIAARLHRIRSGN
jgi:tetratricopeptide (TPR) repeat protein